MKLRNKAIPAAYLLLIILLAINVLFVLHINTKPLNLKISKDFCIKNDCGTNSIQS